MDLPANVCDMSSGIRFHLHSIFVPDAFHILIRNLTFEHSLVFGLHGQVSNALIDL